MNRINDTATPEENKRFNTTQERCCSKDNVPFSEYNLSFCMCICKWHLMIIIKYVTTMYGAVNAMYCICQCYVRHLSNIAKKHSNDRHVTDMYQICDILVTAL